MTATSARTRANGGLVGPAPFLRIAWLRQREGLAPKHRVLLSYVAAIDAAAGVGSSQAYDWIQDPEVEGPGRTIPNEGIGVLPTAFVLTHLNTFDDALDLQRQLRTAAPPAGFDLVELVVYREIDCKPGHSPAMGNFSPEVHFGAYNMMKPEDEFGIASWYIDRRYPRFRSGEGSLRVRRFVSACGGAAKFAVFYEFADRKARHAQFSPTDHEGEAQDPVIERTVHSLLSPTIGSAITG